ncbi:MAG: hypothetical protein RBS27_06290 [Giesbergeria sp.]|jgi:hypothetical protein|nr:hypothetical protein [Giesbergeria sp.]
MGSFARSGETLLLRCLHAHPALHVVHQISEHDRPEDVALFQFLTTYPHTSIAHDHPLIQRAGIAPGKVLIVKYAVWIHAHPFNGFVLARNPLSVAKSLDGYAKANAEPMLVQQARLTRWAHGIDAALAPAVAQLPCRDSTAMLYNRKMLPLAESGLPVLRYEDLTRDPHTSLRWLLQQLELPWDSAVEQSHTAYAEGQYGHGGIALWKPIHPETTLPCTGLSEIDVARIQGYAWPTMARLGYRVRNGALDVLPLQD